MDDKVNYFLKNRKKGTSHIFVYSAYTSEFYSTCTSCKKTSEVALNIMRKISQPKHIHNAMVAGKYTADSELLLMHTSIKCIFYYHYYYQLISYKLISYKYFIILD